MATAGDQNPAKWVETAYLLALSLKPILTEGKICTENLNKAEAALPSTQTRNKTRKLPLGRLCQMLTGANEFLFVLKC